MMDSSLFTLGTAQLGFNYGIANTAGTIAEKRVFKILDHAILNGISMFDTAPVYGKSETLLGTYFSLNKNFKPDIITKLPSQKHNLHSKNFLLEQVKNSVENSLNKLKSDSIHTLLFHDFNDLLFENNYILNYLKKPSYIKNVGVSVYSPEEAEIAINTDGVSAIQIPTNLMDIRFFQSEIFNLARKKNIQLYIRSIYLQGLLLMNKDNIPSYLAKSKYYLDQINHICFTNSISIKELSVAMIKSINCQKQMVIGCETPQQLIDNVQIVRQTGMISSDIKQKLFKIVESVPEFIVNPTLWR